MNYPRRRVPRRDKAMACGPLQINLSLVTLKRTKLPGNQNSFENFMRSSALHPERAPPYEPRLDWLVWRDESWVPADLRSATDVELQFDGVSAPCGSLYGSPLILINELRLIVNLWSVQLVIDNESDLNKLLAA